MSQIEDRLRRRIDDLDGRLSEVLQDTRELGESATDESGRIAQSELDSDERRAVLRSYEIWYNSGRPLVEDHLPERLHDFNNAYESYVDLLELNHMGGMNFDIFERRFLEHTDTQINLLSSIPAKIESEQLTIRRQISDKIISDEIQRAYQLFEDDEIRVAGVLTGIALERHLLTLCESSNQNLQFGYMDGIQSLSQTLSDAGEITDDDQRLLEYLAGIRNKCSHANDDEPEYGEVNRLLSQADKFINSS